MLEGVSCFWLGWGLCIMGRLQYVENGLCGTLFFGGGLASTMYGALLPLKPVRRLCALTSRRLWGHLVNLPAMGCMCADRFEVF